MKLDIHGVAMVQSPAVVNCSLPKHCDRKLLVEGVRKEALNLPGVAEAPTTGSRETREGRGTNETLLCEPKVLRDLFVGGCFHEHASNLRFSTRHLTISFADLLLSERQGTFVLFDLRLRDQSFSEQFFRLLELFFSPLHFVFVKRQQFSKTCFIFICESDVFVAQLCEFSLRRPAGAGFFFVLRCAADVNKTQKAQ